MIEQTLALGQIDQMVEAAPLQRTVTDLNHIVDSLVNSSRDLAVKSKIVFNYMLASVPIMVEADSDKLGTAILNILTNAFTYTPPGGEVSLSLEQSGQRAKIQIKDTGLGISSADREYIFDRFFRGELITNGSIPGLGLGLSIAQKCIALHDGEIHVESNLGQGSIFTIYLPLSKTLAPTNTAPTNTAPTNTAPTNHETMLFTVEMVNGEW